MPIDKVVIDTNNIISLVLKGDLAFLVRLSYIYDCELYTCAEQLEEIKRVLEYDKIKKNISGSTRDILKFIEINAIEIEIDKRVDRVKDNNDNFLFDLAYSCKSYFLVSGDREVLALKQVNKIRVISMIEFKKLLINKKTERGKSK
ncbi:putative toxin-antitoxin system toxin component, PIN family [Flavobacterium filum]|uniref:putative toxin-antitoxin system toxin component, PIN family n=1 Tax=Flavobacterium filum TaxID=370974 RepID=UPI0023F2AD69|nr:putative toxin-antitoxin system toxin component, PIN family [Flavobacterium filum]